MLVLIRNGFKYFSVNFLPKPFLCSKCGNIFFNSSSTDPWNYLNIFWTLAFSLIVMAALLGNCLVLWIVCGEILNVQICFKKLFEAHRRMWSVTNYFLLNLTMADILMASLNCIFSFVYMRDR